MYTDHYGLSGPPFADAADPAFYFDSETHRKAMAYLGYGLAQGEGFIVLTGEEGTGKTTLIGHLLATIDHARLLPARVRAVPGMTGAALLTATAAAFGLGGGDGFEEETFTRIEHFLIGQARGDRQCLLIVDDAEHLATAALAVLSRLGAVDAERATLQIGLFGTPALHETLAAPLLEPLRQRVIATHRLEPLQPGEIEAYVEHRLALVGCLGAPRFAADVFAALYARTGGVPRAVNRLADRLLEWGAAEGRSVLDAEAVARALDAPVTPPDDSALAGRVAALETRAAEQETALRGVLGILIEWIESENEPPP